MENGKTEVAIKGTSWRKDLCVPVSEVEPWLAPLVNYTNNVHHHRKIQNYLHLKGVWRCSAVLPLVLSEVLEDGMGDCCHGF